MYEYKDNKYVIRDFTDKELAELDKLADLMLNCDDNLDILYKIYTTAMKYRIMLGISTWN